MATPRETQVRQQFKAIDQRHAAALAAERQAKADESASYRSTGGQFGNSGLYVSPYGNYLDPALEAQVARTQGNNVRPSPATVNMAPVARPVAPKSPGRGMTYDEAYGPGSTVVAERIAEERRIAKQRAMMQAGVNKVNKATPKSRGAPGPSQLMQGLQMLNAAQMGQYGQPAAPAAPASPKPATASGVVDYVRGAIPGGFNPQTQGKPATASGVVDYVRGAIPGGFNPSVTGKPATASGVVDYIRGAIPGGFSPPAKPDTAPRSTDPAINQRIARMESQYGDDAKKWPKHALVTLDRLIAKAEGKGKGGTWADELQSWGHSLDNPQPKGQYAPPAPAPAATPAAPAESGLMRTIASVATGGLIPISDRELTSRVPPRVGRGSLPVGSRYNPGTMPVSQSFSPQSMPVDPNIYNQMAAAGGGQSSGVGASGTWPQPQPQPVVPYGGAYNPQVALPQGGVPPTPDLGPDFPSQIPVTVPRQPLRRGGATLGDVANEYLISAPGSIAAGAQATISDIQQLLKENKISRERYRELEAAIYARQAQERATQPQ